MLWESEAVKALLFLPAERNARHKPGQCQGQRLFSVNDGFLDFGGQEVEPIDAGDVFQLKIFSLGDSPKSCLSASLAPIRYAVIKRLSNSL